MRPFREAVRHYRLRVTWTKVKAREGSRPSNIQSATLRTHRQKVIVPERSVVSVFGLFLLQVGVGESAADEEHA
jgi:hypothetical protein